MIYDHQRKYTIEWDKLIETITYNKEEAVEELFRRWANRSYTELMYDYSTKDLLKFVWIMIYKEPYIKHDDKTPAPRWMDDNN
jgi:hypothetical protein